MPERLEYSFPLSTKVDHNSAWFHGTSAHWLSTILTEGLKPGKKDPPSSPYTLAKLYSNAAMYAGKTAYSLKVENGIESPGVVLISHPPDELLHRNQPTFHAIAYPIGNPAVIPPKYFSCFTDIGEFEQVWSEFDDSLAVARGKKTLERKLQDQEDVVNIFWPIFSQFLLENSQTPQRKPINREMAELRAAEVLWNHLIIFLESRIRSLTVLLENIESDRGLSFTPDSVRKVSQLLGKDAIEWTESEVTSSKILSDKQKYFASNVITLLQMRQHFSDFKFPYPEMFVHFEQKLQDAVKKTDVFTKLLLQTEV
jgi:hypothetical protein